MKKLLLFSLLFFATHILCGMKEDLIVEQFNNLNLNNDDFSIREILELKDLEIFVENLKKEKRLEDKNRFGWTLLQIAVDNYVSWETRIQQLETKIKNFFNRYDTPKSDTKCLEWKAELFTCKRSLERCFILIKHLLDAGAKMDTIGQWGMTTYRYVMFLCNMDPESEILKKLKKVMRKKEQENK